MKPYALIGPFVVLLAAGCNKPPSAPIIHVGPTSPTTTDDLVVYIDVEASDPNPRDLITYTYAWYQDGTLRGDLTTDTVPASETTKSESWRVVVIPNDGHVDGRAAEDEVWVVNTPPIAEVSLAPEAPLTTEDVVATITTTDDDEDTVTLTYVWTMDGEETEYDEETLPGDATTKGEVWEVTATPNDGEEDGDQVTASVSIENSLPVISYVTIAPDPTYEADTIEATVDAGDDDDDELSYTYAWSVDGTVVQESEVATLTGELFDKHQEVFVTVTASDSWVDGEPVSSGSVTISNTVPSISGVDLDPTDLYEASTVTCVPSGWADDDGDAETYAFAWAVNGADAGVAADTLDGGSFDKGDELACTATPCDDDECGDALASEAAMVLNTAPTLASATLSTSSPQEGDTITVSLGTVSDDDGDTVSYGYAWYAGGVEVGTTAAVTGAVFDKGDDIYVIVTPNDGDVDGASVTSDTATAVNTVPVITSVSLSVSECYTDDTLTASVSSSDADGDTVSFTYTWYVDGGIVGVTGSALDGSLYFDKGDEVYVVATPNDGESDGLPATSMMTTVLNTAPEAPVVFIEPDEPIEGENDLVCVVGDESTDTDGDTVTYTFTWSVDGAAFLGATTTVEVGDTIQMSDTTAGEIWACFVTPNDGDEDGADANVEVEVLPACDVDGDGYDSVACGGDDCDDADGSTNPGEVESCGDGIDQDCDGVDEPCRSSGDYDLATTGIKLVGEDSGDNAGRRVAFAGDVNADGYDDLLVGAIGADEGGDLAGVAYLVLGPVSVDASLSAAAARFIGEEAGDYAGYSVVSAGDVDADGYSDILIGAPFNDRGGDLSGAVYLVSGPVTGDLDLSAADLILTGEAEGDRAGYPVASAGDVNADGYDDLLIGACYDDDAGVDAGAVHLLYGPVTSGADLSSSDAKLIGEAAHDYAGVSVASAGDVDADGFSDMIVGAQDEDEGGSSAGAAYIVYGPVSGDLDLGVAGIKLVGEDASDSAGLSVASAGDVNGDGFDDVLIGAPEGPATGSGGGAAYLVYGPVTADLDLSAADAEFVGEYSFDYAGQCVSSAGDGDGDGFDDLVIGANGHDDGGNNAGAAYVLYGPISGDVELRNADVKFIGGSDSDYVGSYVAGGADLDGDGNHDVLVGAPGYDDSGASIGAVYVLPLLGL